MVLSINASGGINICIDKLVDFFNVVADSEKFVGQTAKLLNLISSYSLSTKISDGFAFSFR